MYMSFLSLSLHRHIYIYIYIYICVCECVYYIYIYILYIYYHYKSPFCWLAHQSLNIPQVPGPALSAAAVLVVPPSAAHARPVTAWGILGKSSASFKSWCFYVFQVISFPSCVFSGVSMCFLTSVVHLASDVRKGKDGRERRSKTKQNLKSTSQQLLLHLLLPSFSNIESRQCHARHKITEDRASTKDR